MNIPRMRVVCGFSLISATTVSIIWQTWRRLLCAEWYEFRLLLTRELFSLLHIYSLRSHLSRVYCEHGWSFPAVAVYRTTAVWGIIPVPQRYIWQHQAPNSTPVFGVRGRFHGVKCRKPLRVTFFHLRGLESCGEFFPVWGHWLTPFVREHFCICARCLSPQ
jgi:hypothetical protein